MQSEFESEVNIAKEIIKILRDKENKNSKELEAIIDLNYFMVIYTNYHTETYRGKEILERIRKGYYDGIYKQKVNKCTEVTELKLCKDNMQYCFF